MRDPNKTHDSLKRRLRHAKVDDGKPLIKRPTDILWYEFLQAHGGILPTKYVIASTKALRKNDKGGVRRLARLFLKDRITRYKIAFRSSNPLAQDQLHGLSDDSRSILDGQNKLSEWAPKMNPPMEHHLMGSTITASFDIACRNTPGFAYSPQHEAFQAPLEIPRGKTTMRPDGGFVIGTPETKFLCFLEADRSTEPATSTSLRKTLESMVESYKTLIVFDGTRLYQEHFKVQNTNALLIFVTTTESKRKAFLKQVEKHFPNGCNFILTHVIPDYGPDYNIPGPMDMLDVNWLRFYPKQPVFRFKPKVDK